MKIAILTDIHGNSIALDAVLRDIETQGGADGYWFLGDYCAIGFDPVGVLERITQLPNTRFIYGNADRYITRFEYPPPFIEETRHNPAMIEKLAEVSRTFAWTQGALTATGWLDWLTDLLLEERLTLPDGTRVLLVHASPGTDESFGIRPDIHDEQVAELLVGCTEEVVFVGHTHIPVDRIVNGIRIINPGGVSNPTTPDLQAKYAVLQADEKGYQVELRAVDYDLGAVIDAVRRVRHPSPDYIISFFEGKMITYRPPETS